MANPLTACAASMALAAAGPAAAGSAAAIYTNITGHPTAQVPGVPGSEFRAPLAPFLALYGSPNGTYWIFKGFSDDPDTANEVIVAGSGMTGTTVAREGDPAPLPGLAYGFMDSDCGIDESGRYAFGNRLSGGPATTDEVLFVFDGSDIVVAVREGDVAPGLVDPDGAGNELYGNSLNSAHVLASGAVAYKADLIQNIDTDYRSALYQGALVVSQEGTGGTIAGEIIDSFVSLSGNTFSSSADGSAWVVEADIGAGVASVEAVIVSGSILLRDGDLVPGFASPVESIFAVDMGGNGDWFARGALADGRDWAVRNGQVIAASGEPVGATGLVYDGLLAVNGNGAGDFVIFASTTDGGQVAVLNGTEVIAASGDPVDLGAVGPVQAFIGTFDANDIVFSDDLDDDLVDDRSLYAFVGLRDEALQDIGDALIVVRLADPCPWDCGSDDGLVDVVDFLALLAEWGVVSAPCDINGGGVGVVDFLDLLAHWGPCP
jgi:hypothetical protein